MHRNEHRSTGLQLPRFASPCSRNIANIACRLLVACVTLCAASATAETNVRGVYLTEIQPILSENCFQCHGTDEGSREGGLRLDMRESALRGGDSGNPAITPKNPEESELLKRLVTQDPSERMPPSPDHPALSNAEIEQIRSWIESGAVYEPHWSFVAPEKVKLSGESDEHPIDQIIAMQQKAVGLQRSPPASDHALCRRLYLDVIGLPPSPQELHDFSKVGIKETIKELLASPRYGEKWARHWMDVARYSDTNGYEKDLRREQWIWRDWVIKAINRDLPFDDFIIEQLAGDLLPNASQEQKIATGFLRNSMLNEEGAIIPEQFRMFEMFDRIDCIGKAVLGMTPQCAQCHSHKYDPISMTEYYGLFAFLNNSYEAKSWIYTDEQQLKIKNLKSEIAKTEEQIKKQVDGWEAKLNEFEQKTNAELSTWKPIRFHDMNSVSGLNHPVHEPDDDSILMLGHTSADVYFISRPEITEPVTGIQLEALTHLDLPFAGPGRSDVGGWAVREFEVFTRPAPDADWEKQTLANPTADYSEPDQPQDGGKKAVGPVAYLIDGNNETQWKADRGLGQRNTPSVAVMQFAEPMTLPKTGELKVVMRMSDMLGCCRISLTTTPSPKVPPVAYEAVLAMRTKPENRTQNEQAAIFTAWRLQEAAAQQANQAIDALWKQFPNALTSVLHFNERSGTKNRVTHLLMRGNWDQPQQIVQPHTPDFLHPIDQSHEVPPRLRFARWLVDTRSPLTARVAVNRIWQQIFGIGLVETTDDLGTRTQPPLQQDLLDWLAVDFMENGWSRKHLLQTIFTSETYQQVSRTNAKNFEADPTNAFLARGPRFRADAEVIRDIALTVSGLMHHQIGGPSVIPPVPQNVLHYNYVYPSYWTPATGPQRYRRAVYSFRKRSMPDPSMSSLDAPNADTSCVRRVRSNTALGALTTLNEPIFVEASRAFALRVLRESPMNDLERVRYAYLLCTARTPNQTEEQSVLELLALQRKRIADGWLDARTITTGKADQLPDLPAEVTPQDAAAWTVTARVLLNLDETISKN